MPSQTWQPGTLVVYTIVFVCACDEQFNKDVEWNPEKRAAHLEKHGVDFVDAAEVFAQPHLAVGRSRSRFARRGVAFFRSQGRGCQTRINDVLKACVLTQRLKAQREAIDDETPQSYETG
jgi:hypothetical protein